MTHYPQKIATERGTDSALIDERGEISWQTFNERTNQLLSALRGLGLGAGDRVAVYAGNCREYYEIMMATIHTGIVWVPVNWHFSPEELAYVVADSEAKALFAEGQFLDRAAAAANRGETPSLAHCFAIRADRKA